jgi:elongation factor G
VDSDSLSFEIAARIAFREATKKTKSVLLEPVMKLEVLTPDQYVGDVTGDLNRRRAVVEGVDTKIGLQAIKVKVPLANMFGYVTTLRTLTSGRAVSSMEFSHYEAVPANVQEEIIKRIKGTFN